MQKELATLLRHPSIVRPYRRIFLFSHMRANTSLFGHILGSSPEIEGYYEMHMGYYSWKSLIRQKLLYFADHKPKSGSRFIFDKILHNEHWVNFKLFGPQDKFIISVREPASSISSTVKLYGEIDSSHECATLAGATDYYQSRLEGLVEIANQLKGRYFFLEADMLRKEPEKVLNRLSSWLGLQEGLEQEYNTFPKTGAKRVGDTSDALRQGSIKSLSERQTNKIVVSADADSQYQACLTQLLSDCGATL